MINKKYTIVIGTIAVTLWGVNLLVALNVSRNDSNLIGDSFGAVNALFSVAAFVGVLISLNVQRKEHEKLEIQKFESTFFLMTEQLQRISDGTSYTVRYSRKSRLDGMTNDEYRGTECYSFVLKDLIAKLAKVREPELALHRNGYDHETDELTLKLLKQFPIGPNENLLSNRIVDFGRLFDIENYPDYFPNREVSLNEINEYVEVCYMHLLAKYTDVVDHFYRYLNSILKFLDNQTVRLQLDNTFYSKIIQAQLTNAQLGLLFYSSFTPVSRNENGQLEFKELLEKYQLLQNLPKDYCPVPQLLQNYPQTRFKYLGQVKG